MSCILKYFQYKNQENFGTSMGNTKIIIVDDSDDFKPMTITINVGDTIIWRNYGKRVTHNAIAYNRLFNSGDIKPGQSFSFKFTKVGTFKYYCSYHRDEGMIGTIIVK